MHVQLVVFIFALLGLIWFKETGSIFNQYKKRKRYVIFMMFLLSIQSGLRNLGVGADTYAYMQMFYNDINESWSYFVSNLFYGNIKDIGYHLISKLFGTFIPNFRCFLIVIAILFFGALGSFFMRYLKSNYEVCVSIALYECLYYSFFSITGLRQTIATAILLYAVKYAIDKKIAKYIMLILIATTIHKTALLFAPFYLLGIIKKNRIIFIVAFLLFVPMFFAGNFLGNILRDTSMENYAHYLDQKDTNGAYVFTIYIMLLAVLTFIKLRDVNKLAEGCNMITSSIAIALFLSPLLILDANNQRIVQYYSVFGLIILPRLCTVYSNFKFKRLVYMIVFFVFALYTLHRRVEYKFYWQDMILVGKDASFIINDNAIKY